jgi:hypothetical protein
VARTASRHSVLRGKRDRVREHWAQRPFSPVDLLNLWEPTGAWEEYRGLAYGEGLRHQGVRAVAPAARPKFSTALIDRWLDSSKGLAHHLDADRRIEAVGQFLPWAAHPPRL